MPYIWPKTWEDGVMPLSEFPEWKRDEILEAASRPKPPPRWISLSNGLAQIESRAWYEWHWSRGMRLRYVAPTGKRRKLTKGRRQKVIERDGLTCGICKTSVELHDVHIDHVLPVVHGGTNELDNLRVTHSRCNILKGAKV